MGLVLFNVIVVCIVVYGSLVFGLCLVPNVACVSGLSRVYYPFGFL